MNRRLIPHSTVPEIALVIVHILLGLINSVLRAFVAALLLLFSTAISAVLGIGVLVFIVLLLTGTVSFGVSRRKIK